ncbi:putative wd repeat-containing protein 79 [Diplodia seriata]|uniref:Putative wd repeat-containing protein 79 n=1 Tax=Diplodia seriata TaxID=420778 RepID=A0A0G2FWS7_9PEZI|nr:putative wd repeat-containing protein 79 [Diplodia seriata]
MYDTDDVMHVSVDCIKFLPDTVHFLAAGNNCLALFDITRKKSRLDPLALGGRISTIDYRDDGLLAVGSWASKIGFYEDYGKGEVLAVDSMSDFADGIQTVRWSPDGSYLYVAGPTTDFITILDVRMAGRKVSFLTGRNAWSKQRHGFDLVFDDNGHHVIAGGSDGAVRVWHNPTTRSEGNTGPGVEWQAHDDHIAAVAVNPRWANVVATTAGSRHFPAEEDYNTSDGSDTDEGSVTVDNSSQVEPRLDGGVNELDAPVPKGWMKIWRC